jgi:hypothetical protein
VAAATSTTATTTTTVAPTTARVEVEARLVGGGWAGVGAA